ncbi:HK97 family phage prohead protease [Enterococcus faecalis]
MCPIQFQTRDNADVNKNKLCGYAVRFNEPSEDLGGFIETIAPTAFQNVNMQEVLCLYNHDTANILARSDSNTLTLRADDTGLYFEAVLPDTTLARDVLANVQAGNIKGCSFGFTVKRDSWQWSNGTEPDQRRVEEIDQLFEITLTPIPAYKQTTVDKRSLEHHRNKIRQRDKLLHYYNLGDE